MRNSNPDYTQLQQAQSGKSDAVLRESATVLMKLGFKEESAFLSGEQIKPHPVKYVMHWNDM